MIEGARPPRGTRNSDNQRTSTEVCHKNWQICLHENHLLKTPVNASIQKLMREACSNTLWGTILP